MTGDAMFQGARHGLTSCPSGRIAKHARWKVPGKSKQGRSSILYHMVRVVICVRNVASSQGPPTEATRRRTAEHILDIMSARSFRGAGKVCCIMLL